MTATTSKEGKASLPMVVPIDRTAHAEILMRHRRLVIGCSRSSIALQSMYPPYDPDHVYNVSSERTRGGSLKAALGNESTKGTSKI